MQSQMRKIKFREAGMVTFFALKAQTFDKEASDKSSMINPNFLGGFELRRNTVVAVAEER